MAMAGKIGFELVRFYSDDFNFNEYKPPLYSFESVCWLIASYLAAIRLTTWYMSAEEKPFHMKWISAIHNFFLFVLSVAMFFGVTANVFDMWIRGGNDAIFCGADPSFRMSKMYFWIYVFYLSKPYEFVDTFIMIFKKRELNFLHVWHHCTTFLLVWVTQVQEMNIQWISVSANCLVHSFMYYYYFVSCLGKHVWWKRYLTLLQIFQFVITTVFNCYWGYAYWRGYGCAGTIQGFWFGMFIIISFLALFIKFYVENYKSGRIESNGNSPRNTNSMQSPASPSSPRRNRNIKKDD